MRIFAHYLCKYKHEEHMAQGNIYGVGPDFFNRVISV